MLIWPGSSPRPVLSPSRATTKETLGTRLVFPIFLSLAVSEQNANGDICNCLVKDLKGTRVTDSQAASYSLFQFRNASILTYSLRRLQFHIWKTLQSPKLPGHEDLHKSWWDVTAVKLKISLMDYSWMHLIWGAACSQYNHSDMPLAFLLICGYASPKVSISKAPIRNFQRFFRIPL